MGPTNGLRFEALGYSNKIWNRLFLENTLGEFGSQSALLHSQVYKVWKRSILFSSALNIAY